MPLYIESNASDTTPRLFRRKIKGTYNPSNDDKEKLQSTSFFRSLDLICEGPIEGFCDATGALITDGRILQGVYLNNVPVQLTLSPRATQRFNFRNISVAYKFGTEDQEPLYVDSETNENFAWLEDCSYSSSTSALGTVLDNQLQLEAGATAGGVPKELNSQANYSVIDADVDWLAVTLNIEQCYSINEDGDHKPNQGQVMIFGDFTGAYHRSHGDTKITPVPNDGGNDYSIVINYNGMAMAPYQEEVFLKLRDVKDLKRNKNRRVYIKNATEETYNFKRKWSVAVPAVTEIVEKNLSYPFSAYIAVLCNAESFSSVPNRSFHLKLKKVKVPSNYVEKIEGPNGPTNKRAYNSQFGAKESTHASEERHEGFWDGTFKDELEWTDNPAWILYDILTNDVYGLGEYIKSFNIDKWELYKIAKFCDELVETSKPHSTSSTGFKKERRFSCNIVLGNAADAFNTISELASVFRGVAYFNNQSVFFSVNRLKESIHKFTNDSVIEGIFRYTGAPKHSKFTAIRVAYKDKDNNYLTKYEYIEDPEGIIKFGLVMKETTAIGCTSRDQALRLGRWILLTSNLEEGQVSFTSDSQAEYLNPGDVFTVRDEIKNTHRFAGRIKEIKSDSININENYILFDQNLDLENFNIKDISLLIPSEDVEDENVEQYKAFIHRDGYNLGNQDGGFRKAEKLFIPLNSEDSENLDIHSYLVNTENGTKFITNEEESAILKKTHKDSLIGGGAGHKTLNDYLLDSEVLAQLTNGTVRSKITQKIKEGTLYFISAEAKDGSDLEIIEQDFQLIRKSDNGDGTYAIVGQDFNRDKFDKTENLSTIYKHTTFSYDTDDTEPGAGGDDEIPERILPPAPQVENPTFPRENTVDLLITTTGFVNTEGETKSRVNYYFHNTQENNLYYQDDYSKNHRYEIRCSEVDEDKYTTLFQSQFSVEEDQVNILQEGQYILSGVGKCGEYRVLYDHSIGEPKVLTPSGKALLGGTIDRHISVPNYNETDFSPFVNIVRSRNRNEWGEIKVEGCELFDKIYENQTTGYVLSGQFELPNPDAYYELRWFEANDKGTSPEKIMFFKGSRDDIPPGPVSDFQIRINNLFPNMLNYSWQHQGAKDPDLAGFRIYTGHINGDNPDYEFSNLDEDGAPNPGSEFAEIMGKNASYFTYEANTKDGTIRDNDGNRISFNDTGAFHIRAFDMSNNLSVPANSNILTLFQFADAPDIFLSGEIREEGVGTDTYGYYPILHVFYSGSFHEQDAFSKYSLSVLDETNGFGVSTEYDIFRNGIKIADNNVYSAGNSGHYEVRNVLPNSTYLGRISAVTTDGRLSPEGSDRTTIGKDDFAPGKLKNFRVDKQFSNFRFSWDEPIENDVKNVLLFTGLGGDNFDIEKEDEDDIKKLEVKPKNLPFASVLPDDSPAFRADKFKNVGDPFNETFKFHGLAVDTSNNTGMYEDFTYKYVDLQGPNLHTSGQLTDDGRSLVHVFYSGQGQSDESFRYYLTQYQDTQDLAIQSFQGLDKASYISETDRQTVSEIHGEGSGHFSFEARGNRFYEIRAKMVFDAFESRWADDIVLTDSKDGYIKAVPDKIPPGKPKWISATKNGNNIFLSWENPPDHDLLGINLYTGNKDSKLESEGTFIHQRALQTSQVIPLRDFAANKNKQFYFYLQAVDTSLNTGEFSSLRELNVGITRQLDRKEIYIHSGIMLDEDGDGSAKPFISYKILDEPINFQHAIYDVQLSTNDTYNPLVSTQTIEVEHIDDLNLNSGSGTFLNLNANTEYHLRARIREFDGKSSLYTEAWDNPILTPKDDIPPKNPENFYIISGPKQAILEWDWSAGISSDIASVLVYKTGIPTGRVATNSHKINNCWSAKHISGYFEDNPDDYSYKLNASTSFVDNDIETGIAFPNASGPKQSIYYHYLLKTVDRSNNTGENFVSGKSRDPHEYYWVNKAKTQKDNFVNERYGETPHYHGYITGGAVSADYITNIYAGRILTDKLTTTDLILSHPSGRLLSDNVYAMGSNDHKYDYMKGTGVYIDHKMFRIGDPDPGGFGLFWTGEKLSNGDFKVPTFNEDSDGFHAIDINPNTLEIRGNLTAGTIQIGASEQNALSVDDLGNLTIGNQSKDIQGFFSDRAGVSGILGEIPSYISSPDPDAVYVQLDKSDISTQEAIELQSMANGGGFLETNWIRGRFRGWEVRAIEKIETAGNDAKKWTVKLGVPFSAYVGYNFFDIQGNEYGLSGVVATGSKDVFLQSNAPSDSLIGYPKVRDWWRVHQAKFKVTNDGVLFAADARILGTAKADSLEVNKTIVLGDTYNKYTSIIQSHGFEEGNTCDGINPSGWKIVGDGHAIFRSIDIRSGVISGSVGLAIGQQCDDTYAFRANQFGEIAVGDSNVLHNNNFYVSNQGNITANDARLKGDLSVSGSIDVGDGILLGSKVTRDQYGNVTSVVKDENDGILITSNDIRSLSYTDDFDGAAGFKIDNKGRGVFHNIAVTGGALSGVSLIIGKGTQTSPYFKAFSDGEISVGSYNGAGTAPSKNDPFYVSKKGELWANDARIRGTISGNAGLIGSLYIGPTFVSTYNEGANASIRTSNSLQKADDSKSLGAGNYRTGLFIGRNSEFSITNSQGKLIGWNGSNKYLTVTGLASSSSENASFYTNEGTSSTQSNFEKGVGFYLQGGGGGSYISNFTTDTSSAKNIASKVITHICGEIHGPIVGTNYTLLAKSKIGYTVKEVYLECDGSSNTCKVQMNRSHHSVDPAEQIGDGTFEGSSVGITESVNTNNKILVNSAENRKNFGYIVLKVQENSGGNIIKFRIELIRDNSYA